MPSNQQQVTGLEFLLAMFCLHMTSLLLLCSESLFSIEPHVCELPPTTYCDNVYAALSLLD